MRNAAGQRALRIKGIMQKLAGSIPRPALLSGVRCGRCAVGWLPQSGKSATAKALARKSASGKAARARCRWAGCDCSSLPPLTLKPLRSPTPRPFAAVATAFYVRLRRTRGSTANGHGSGGCGSWLQRRQPSTMSAGWGVVLFTSLCRLRCGAPSARVCLFPAIWFVADGNKRTGNDKYNDHQRVRRHLAEHVEPTGRDGKESIFFLHERIPVSIKVTAII